MARACVVCHKEGVEGGRPVEDDLIIRSIRAAKQKLGIARNNVLVVEEGCMDDYRAKRAKYERDLAIHTVIGGLVLLLFILLPVFTSGFSLVSVLLGLLLFGLIMLLSIFSHCPKVAGAETRQVATREPPEAVAGAMAAKGSAVAKAANAPAATGAKRARAGKRKAIGRKKK